LRADDPPNFGKKQFDLAESPDVLTIGVGEKLEDILPFDASSFVDSLLD